MSLYKQNQLCTFWHGIGRCPFGTKVVFFSILEGSEPNETISSLIALTEVIMNEIHPSEGISFLMQFQDPNRLVETITVSNPQFASEFLQHYAIRQYEDGMFASMSLSQFRNFFVLCEETGVPPIVDIRLLASL